MFVSIVTTTKQSFCYIIKIIFSEIWSSFVFICVWFYFQEIISKHLINTLSYKLTRTTVSEWAISIVGGWSVVHRQCMVSILVNSSVTTGQIYFKFGQKHPCDSLIWICYYFSNWKNNFTRAKNRKIFKHRFLQNHKV